MFIKFGQGNPKQQLLNQMMTCARSLTASILGENMPMTGDQPAFHRWGTLYACVHRAA